MLFRGRLTAPFTFAAREPESLEAALFEPEAIPWDQLAFSSVSIALQRCGAEGGRAGLLPCAEAHPGGGASHAVRGRHLPAQPLPPPRRAAFLGAG